MRLTCGSFQLTHMSRDDHAVQFIEPWRPKRRQNIITALTTLPQGWVRHVSINTRQRSLRYGQNLHGPFLRATLQMTVGLCARAMAINGKTKALRTLPPRWVSAQLLYVLVNVRRRSRWCSQNLRRPFLQAVRFLYLYYITWHNFSPTRSVIACVWVTNGHHLTTANMGFTHARPITRIYKFDHSCIHS